jgi:hypothetical protein
LAAVVVAAPAVWRARGKKGAGVGRRFAIGTHRARRKKDFVESPLHEIPGIGPARKRALQHAFGSAKDVANAGLADLEKTPGSTPPPPSASTTSSTRVVGGKGAW